MVAIVDTRHGTLLGQWDINPLTTNGRAHAGVSKNGRTLYVASDATNEVVALDPRTGEVFWSMPIFQGGSWPATCWFVVGLRGFEPPTS